MSWCASLKMATLHLAAVLLVPHLTSRAAASEALVRPMVRRDHAIARAGDGTRHSREHGRSTHKLNLICGESADAEEGLPLIVCPLSSPPLMSDLPYADAA